MQEGIPMCRRRDLHNCCLLCFALGVLFGRWVDSWFLCGGIVVLCFCMPLFRHR